MKHLFHAAASLMWLATIFEPSAEVMAQHKPSKKMGKASEFIKELKSNDEVKSKGRLAKKSFRLDPDGKLSSDLKNFSKKGKQETFSGYISDDSTSNVNIVIENETVSGSIVIQKDRKAYKYQTKGGEVFLEETDIDSLICVEFSQGSSNFSGTSAPATVIPQYESRPGAPAVVYLDFDGEYVVSSSWNGGNPIDAAHSGFSTDEIALTFAIMSEDFAPYNVNITTKRNLYDATPAGKKNMVIFTPTTTAAPGWGGVAAIGSFTNTAFTPCWVFNAGLKAAGETGSHEVGHVMGLYHDGFYNPNDFSSGEYFPGHTNNVWGPIMGSAFNPKVVQWSKGEYQHANNTNQDDIAIIGSANNNFGFVTDEAGATLTTAKYLDYAPTGNLYSNAGVISKRTDVDVYRFKTNGGVVNLSVVVTPPVTSEGISYPITNLDAKLDLLNASGTLVTSSNPASTGNPSISRTLAAGTYYLRIDGVGTGIPATNGYSDYGSIGRYTISGSIQNAVSNDFYLAITEPEQNIVLLDPITVTIKPSFKSPGTITKIEYFKGTTKLGQSTVAPFTFSKSDFTEGTHTIYAKATNSSLQTITSSNITFTVYRSVAADTGTFNSGIIYEFYEGAFTTLPNFNNLTPAYKGITYMITAENQPYYIPRSRIDNFAIRFKGHMEIYEEGLYNIALKSDEGSKLFIGNKLLIDNNGLHTVLEKTGKVYLKKGFIPLEVQYFEATGTEILSLTLTNAETGQEYFPNLVRKDQPANYPVYMDTQVASGIKYEYNEGSYNVLPTNFNNLTYQKVGGLNNISLAIPNRRADNFAVRYSGFVEIPYKGEWVFYLKSDEGSKLYIDDVLLINNDGIHTSAIEKSGKVLLEDGKHKIRLEYFEKTGTEEITLNVAGPNTPKQTLPNSFLTRLAITGDQIGYLYYTPTAPGSFEAENYDQGGEGYSYHDLTVGNQHGMYRSDNVDINVGENSWEYHVAGVQAGEWLKYTINSIGSGTYDVFMTVGSGSTSSFLTLSSSNSSATYQVNVPAITNGNPWQTVVVRNVHLGSGNIYFTITSGTTCNIDRVEFTEPGILRKGADETVLSESSMEVKAVVFPNPFESKLNIDISAFDEVESIKIVDTKGILMWEADASLLNSAIVSFENTLFSGMYLLEIKADQKTFRSTIIKTN